MMYKQMMGTPIVGRFTRPWLLAATFSLILGGCTTLRGGKLWAPETFGFVRVSGNLYVEAGADAPTQASLQDAMRRAEISRSSASL